MYSLEVIGALTEELAGRSEIATAEADDSLEVVATRLRLADRTTKSNRDLMRLGASASVEKEPSDGAGDSVVVRRADPGYFAALERYLSTDTTGFRRDLNSLVVRFLDPGSANATAVAAHARLQAHATAIAAGWSIESANEAADAAGSMFVTQDDIYLCIFSRRAESLPFLHYLLRQNDGSGFVEITRLVRLRTILPIDGGGCCWGPNTALYLCLCSY